ncbi:MAG: hypothetical protein RRY79_01145 [Clostridia bacterium]
MKNLKLLLSINTKRLFAINKIRYLKDGKTVSRVFALVGFIAIAIMMLGMFSMFFFGMTTIFESIGQTYLILAIALISSSAVMLIDTLFTAGSVLFSFTDFDTLMALPIKKSTLVFSRILTLYFNNLFFSVFLMLPALIAYVLYTPVFPLFFVYYLLCFFLAPLIPIAVGTLPGILIGVITSRFKYKNILKIFFSLLLLALYFVFMFSSTDSMGNIINIIISIGNSLNSAYPVAMWFALGLNGAIPELLLFIGLSVLLGSIMSAIVIRYFAPIHAFITSRLTSKKYTLSDSSIKNSSVKKALFKNEMKQYFSSTIYVVNTIFGLLLLTLASVATIVFGEKILTVLASDDILLVMNNLFCILPLSVSMFVSMSCTTQNSISMEGKHLPLLKMLPVSTMTIFYAKLKVYFAMAIPTILIDSTLIMTVFKPSTIADLLYMYAMPLIFMMFSGFFGLYINLVFPKLDWTTEAQYAKQSTSTFIGIFSGMIIPMIFIFIATSLPIDPYIFKIGTTLFMLLLTALFYALLKHDGVKRFQKLI